MWALATDLQDAGSEQKKGSQQAPGWDRGFVGTVFIQSVDY